MNMFMCLLKHFAVPLKHNIVSQLDSNKIKAKKQKTKGRVCRGKT